MNELEMKTDNDMDEQNANLYESFCERLEDEECYLQKVALYKNFDDFAVLHDADLSFLPLYGRNKREQQYHRLLDVIQILESIRFCRYDYDDDDNEPIIYDAFFSFLNAIACVYKDYRQCEKLDLTAGNVRSILEDNNFIGAMNHVCEKINISSTIHCLEYEYVHCRDAYWNSYQNNSNAMRNTILALNAQIIQFNDRYLIRRWNMFYIDIYLDDYKTYNQHQIMSNVVCKINDSVLAG